MHAISASKHPDIYIFTGDVTVDDAANYNLLSVSICIGSVYWEGL